MHYLLIEDDDDHARLTIRSLEREAGTACIDRIDDGESALNYVRHLAAHPHARRPSMILLDLKLPRVSGLELLAITKSDPVLRRIPVIVLSTSDAERDRTEAFDRYANAYIVKPLDCDEFRDMLRSVHEFWSHWNHSTCDS